MRFNLSILAILFSFLSGRGQITPDQSLLDAVRKNDLGKTIRLVNAGANVNAADSNQATVLMWAVYKSDLETVRFLIKHGASVKYKGVIYLNDKLTAYYGNLTGIAAGEGKPDLLKYLIDSCRVPVDDKEYDTETKKETGWTALQWAVSNNQPESVKYLIDKGAGVNMAASDGLTPLMLASQNNNLDLCILLWQNKADFNLKDGQGKTANDHAVENKNSSIVEFLSKPADYKSIQDKKYSTELNEQTLALYHRAEYQKAIPLALKSVEVNSSVYGETHPNYAISLSNLAMIYLNMGQYQKAEPLFIRSLDILKTAGDTVVNNYAKTLDNLGSLYSLSGQYEKAESLYLNALEIKKRTAGESDPAYAFTLNALGQLYSTLGRYEKAASLFMESKEIFRKSKGESSLEFVACSHNLALVYNALGDFEPAEKIYLQNLVSARSLLGESHPEFARVLSSLANLYYLTGRYEKAEPLLLRAKDIWKNSLGEDHPFYAGCLNNLAQIYMELGQDQNAEQLYLRAIEIWKKKLGENHPDYAGGLNNLAQLYVRMGYYERAKAIFTKTIEICRKSLGENHPNYAIALHSLAELYRTMGEYENAEPLAIESVAIDAKSLGKKHPGYATGLNNLALIYEKTGRYALADSLFQETLEILKKAYGANHSNYARCLSNLAELYENMGQPDKVEPLILECSEIFFKNVRSTFSVLSEKEKQEYLNAKLYTIESNNSFVYNYPKISPSILRNNFNEQLVYKSLTLYDERTLLTALEKNSDTTILNLFNSWKKNKRLLARQYSLSGESQIDRLKEIEIETETQEKELARKSSEFRNQQATIRISIQDVQKGLQEDEVAIEFVNFTLYKNKWTDSIIYAAYVLRKYDSVPAFVPLCEEKQLQLLYDSAGKAANTRANSFYRGLKVNNRSVVPLGKELYKLIWQPLEPFLNGIKKISYSPTGKLYAVAFQALPVNSSSLLMDKYQLKQFTSTRQVAIRSHLIHSGKPSGIVLFGNPSFTMDSLQLVKQTQRQTVPVSSTSFYRPATRGTYTSSWPPLPGTAEEIRKVKQLFNQNKIVAQSYIQATATEENLKALNDHSPQILHIATHGFFLPKPDKKISNPGLGPVNSYSLADDPLMRSGLILAGGNYAWSGKISPDSVEDGIVTAYEISQLNLSNTELVVLSACETALGDIKGSEGVFGLQRAFKMAGAKKLIVSLWQVPDKETAELMTSFYTYRMQGKNIDDSFLLAQTGMRKKYPAYYWAAFVLVD